MAAAGAVPALNRIPGRAVFLPMCGALPRRADKSHLTHLTRQGLRGSK